MPPDIASDLARYIDHTLLKAETSRAQVEQLCQQALQYGFMAVCVPPCYVRLATQTLRDSMIRTATVIGFPMGYQTTSNKIHEATEALHAGADELDVVANLGAIKSGAFDDVENELKAIVALAHEQKKVVKWIVEAGMLTLSETEKVCALAAASSVDFVKTSTGILGPGAHPVMVAQLRQLLPAHIQIKASGGIRSRQQALSLLAAGASRLGTSSSVAIVTEAVP